VWKSSCCRNCATPWEGRTIAAITKRKSGAEAKSAGRQARPIDAGSENTAHEFTDSPGMRIALARNQRPHAAQYKDCERAEREPRTSKRWAGLLPMKLCGANTLTRAQLVNRPLVTRTGVEIVRRSVKPIAHHHADARSCELVRRAMREPTKPPLIADSASPDQVHSTLARAIKTPAAIPLYTSRTWFYKRSCGECRTSPSAPARSAFQNPRDGARK